MRLADRFLDKSISAGDNVIVVLFLAARPFTILVRLLLVGPLAANRFDNSYFINQAIVQQAQFAAVGTDVGSAHLETVAVDTLALEQAVQLVEMRDIVHMDWEFDVSGMASTRP